MAERTKFYGRLCQVFRQFRKLIFSPPISGRGRHLGEEPLHDLHHGSRHYPRERGGGWGDEGGKSGRVLERSICSLTLQATSLSDV